MGTTYQASYVAMGSAKGPSARAVENLLAEIDRSMSTYLESSLISEINASADTTAWHAVDRHFQKVFLRARDIHKQTDGAFNPAVGPLVNAWGFGPKDAESLPGDEAIHRLLKITSFDAFEYRHSPPSVRKGFADAQLDFNAIAEGYAVDAIASLLEQGGVRDYLVEIGGEVRARGRRADGNAWRVGIERPAESALAETTIQTVISLHDAALATSGTYRNFTAEDGKKISHILNPRTGRPAVNSLLSVSVLARDTMSADAYATALVVMGLEDALRFVEAREDLEAYFLAKDPAGNIIERSSPGFPKSLPKE